MNGSRPHRGKPAGSEANDGLGADVVPLGVDETARVRLPTADECATYGLAADKPVVEIWRWDGSMEIHQDSAAVVSFVRPEHDPGNEARLARMREIQEDVRSILRTDTSFPLRSAWWCATR